MKDKLKCKSDDGITNTINGGKCKECWLGANYKDWSMKPSGKTNPLCAQTIDCIAVIRETLMNPEPEVLVVSFLKGSFKMASKMFERAIALRKPLYAQGYSFGNIYTPNPEGDYYNWTVAYQGWISQEEYLKAEHLLSAVNSKNVVVDEIIDAETDASSF